MPTTGWVADDRRLRIVRSDARKKRPQIFDLDPWQSEYGRLILAEEANARQASGSICTSHNEEMQTALAQPGADQLPESVGSGKGSRAQPCVVLSQELVVVTRLVIVELIGDQQGAAT